MKFPLNQITGEGSISWAGNVGNSYRNALRISISATSSACHFWIQGRGEHQTLNNIASSAWGHFTSEDNNPAISYNEHGPQDYVQYTTSGADLYLLFYRYADNSATVIWNYTYQVWGQGISSVAENP